MSFRSVRTLPAALRRSQLLWRSPRLWRRRLAFLIGAVAVGLAAAAFAAAADWSLHLFLSLRAQSVWLASALTVAGFASCAAATRWLAPEARGSGIPQAIAARRRKPDSDRSDLLGARVTVVKVILTLFGLACGAAVGREGPTVQLGASIMFLIARFARLPQQSGVVLAGAAAGVAGAFNTPLAGIVFAIEELAKAYDRRVNLLVIAAVAIAGITSIWVAGNYRYFGTISQTFLLRWIWYTVPICAVVGGIFGGMFSAAVVQVAFGRWRFAGFIKARPILFASGCGLVVAVLGLVSDGFANGTSYQATRLALEHGTALPWWYGFCKLGATLLSSISGIPGGLFSPSLSVGAALGSTVSWLMPGVPADVVFLLMMAAYFSAVVQAPLTAFVIVTEMTADTTMAVPLILVTLVSASISRIISPVPLYHALSHTFETKPEKRRSPAVSATE